jgi:drug/metabolite transporter (DMT)-like permease
MWIVVTLAAAGFQIARTSEQHRLRGVLGVAEAGYVRFVYAFPLALLASILWFVARGEAPVPQRTFWGWVMVAGVLQILATMALLHSFRLRDFAVGTIYSKTEVLFVSAASFLFLDESIGWLGWLGAIVCLIGVASLASRGAITEIVSVGLDPAAWFGMAAALGFGVTAVAIRAASTSLEGPAVDRAALTLTAILGVQTVVQGAAIARSGSSSLGRVLRAWRPAVNVAGLSLLGSAAWALAMTLENAAKVRTLGQVEIVLAFAIGVTVHGETHCRGEYLAGVATVAGIALMVIA